MLQVKGHQLFGIAAQPGMAMQRDVGMQGMWRPVERE
jgi:hypothetical protein